MAEELDPFAWVALRGGLVVRQEISATNLPLDDEAHATADLTAWWDPFKNEYFVVDFRIQRQAGVTSEVLRRVPVKALLRSVVQSEARIYRGDGRPAEPVAADQERLRNLARNGPTPETLAAVALVYQLAAVSLEPPAKTVREEFDIPPRTASHWIKLARERGHLAREVGDIDDGEHPATA